MAREDIEDWADRYLLPQGFTKRKTFGAESYYKGKKLFAFLYEDGLCIKYDPKGVIEKIESNPEIFRHFNPGDGIMKNWLCIIHGEAGEYDDEISLIEEAMQLMK